MYRKIICLSLFGIAFLTSCVETVTPVTHGYVKGKVIEWRGHDCYMIDLGTIYKPEKGTVIFIGGVGSSSVDRKDWVIEADCDSIFFIRGVGPTVFTKWPSDIVTKAIKMACETPDLFSKLEHPLSKLNKEMRMDYIYAEINTVEKQNKLILAVNYWARKRIEESK